MLAWLAPQTGVPPEVVLVGAKPPWNQPQLTPLALSRSPTFRPLILTRGVAVVGAAVVERVGVAVDGAGPLASGEPTAPGSGTTCPAAFSGVAPPVWPETRLSAPGVDGPNSVS